MGFSRESLPPSHSMSNAIQLILKTAVRHAPFRLKANIHKFYRLWVKGYAKKKKSRILYT